MEDIVISDITKLREFYEANELAEWFDFCHSNGYDYYQAFLFLYEKTMKDYFALPKFPNIYLYMSAYQKRMQQEANEKAKDFMIWELPVFKSISRHYRKQGMGVKEAEHYAVEHYSGYMREWYQKKFLPEELQQLLCTKVSQKEQV